MPWHPSLLHTALWLRTALLRMGRVGTAQAPASLHILDFSYVRARGHHHALSHLLLQSAHKRHLRARVLASKYIDPALCTQEVKPAFRAGVYDAVENLAALHRKAQHIHRSTLVDLLLQPLSDLTATASTVLIHTTTAWHLQALFELLAAAHSRCRVNAFLMFPPDFDVPPSLAHEQAQACLHAYQFAKAHKLNVRFWCENHLLAQAYQQAGLHDIAFCSLPSDMPAPLPRSKPLNALTPPGKPAPTVFLFMGDPRPDKGFALVLQALPLLAESGLNAVLRLRLTSVLPEHEALLVQGQGPQLDLQVNAFFSDERYFAELAQADAVLLPYDPQAYRLKNSNMVSEAICCGTPVIVPPGVNSLREQASRWPKPLHVAMPEHSALGLIRAMQAFMAQQDTLCSAAQEAAGDARRARDPESFLDTMLN